MADEITTRVMLQVVNGDTNEQIANKTVKIDQTAAATLARYHKTEQLVGTSEENLSLGDVATAGMVYLENMDGTNFITYGNVTTDLGFRLNPGEQALFRVKSGETVIVQADTAAVKIKVGVLAD